MVVVAGVVAAGVVVAGGGRRPQTCFFVAACFFAAFFAAAGVFATAAGPIGFAREIRRLDRGAGYGEASAASPACVYELLRFSVRVIERRARIDDRRAGGRRLGGDDVRGVALHRAGDAPGEAGVRQGALREDEGLIADVRHDQRRCRRRLDGRDRRRRRNLAPCSEGQPRRGGEGDEDEHRDARQEGGQPTGHLGVLSAKQA